MEEGIPARSLAIAFELSDTYLSEEELRKLLASRIAFLMEKDPEQFFAICYRLDVAEHKIKKALQSADKPYLALADLFIRREQVRQHYRKHYSS